MTGSQRRITGITDRHQEQGDDWKSAGDNGDNGQVSPRRVMTGSHRLVVFILSFGDFDRQVMAGS